MDLLRKVLDSREKVAEQEILLKENEINSLRQIVTRLRKDQESLLCKLTQHAWPM